MVAVHNRSARWVAGVTLFLLGSACTSGEAAPSEGPSKGVGQVMERFKAGDVAFEKRADERQARLALEEYRKAHTAHPDDWEAGWRLAMATYFVGLRLTTDKDQKIKLFEEGQEAAKKSFRIHPQCAPCYFWYSINEALGSEADGVFSVLMNIQEIRKNLEKSIAIDPKYAYGGAYRLQGHIEQKLPGILGGDNERAKQFFDKAIQMAPDEPLNYLLMARHLYENWNQGKKAMKYINQGLAIPKPGPERVESRESLQELKLLKGEICASRPDIPGCKPGT